MSKQKSVVAAHTRTVTEMVGTIPKNMDGNDLRIGIVQSRFNREICDGLAHACVEELLRLNVQASDILHVQVPGALEIPLILNSLGVSLQFDALIAIGAVIRGETYHFELVANESGAGVATASREHDLPVINAILTTENEEQARARMVVKGTEAAQAAVEMANLMIMLDGINDPPEDVEEPEILPH